MPQPAPAQPRQSLRSARPGSRQAPRERPSGSRPSRRAASQWQAPPRDSTIQPPTTSVTARSGTFPNSLAQATVGLATVRRTNVALPRPSDESAPAALARSSGTTAKADRLDEDGVRARAPARLPHSPRGARYSSTGAAACRCATSHVGQIECEMVYRVSIAANATRGARCHSPSNSTRKHQPHRVINSADSYLASKRLVVSPANTNKALPRSSTAHRNKRVATTYMRWKEE
jgi:hypothetical protein